MGTGHGTAYTINNDVAISSEPKSSDRFLQKVRAGE